MGAFDTWGNWGIDKLRDLSKAVTKKVDMLFECMCRGIPSENRNAISVQCSWEIVIETRHHIQ